MHGVLGGSEVIDWGEQCQSTDDEQACAEAQHAGIQPSPSETAPEISDIPRPALRIESQPLAQHTPLRPAEFARARRGQPCGLSLLGAVATERMMAGELLIQNTS